MRPLRMLRESGDNTPAAVAKLLAENVVFHSPLLVRALEGRERAAAIMAASPKLPDGAYTAEFRLDDRNTFLRWKGNIESREIESFGVVTNNDQGLVVDYTIVSRPLPRYKLFATSYTRWSKTFLDRSTGNIQKTPRSAGFYDQLVGGIVPCRRFSSRDAKSE